jgi:hypothetical protein
MAPKQIIVWAFYGPPATDYCMGPPLAYHFMGPPLSFYGQIIALA